MYWWARLSMEMLAENNEYLVQNWSESLNSLQYYFLYNPFIMTQLWVKKTFLSIANKRNFLVHNNSIAINTLDTKFTELTHSTTKYGLCRFFLSTLETKLVISEVYYQVAKKLFGRRSSWGTHILRTNPKVSDLDCVRSIPRLPNERTGSLDTLII